MQEDLRLEVLLEVSYISGVLFTVDTAIVRFSFDACGSGICVRGDHHADGVRLCHHPAE